MTISLSSASLPVFAKFLGNLRHLLTKAQADVLARGYDEQALVQYRLSPDMLPFKRQISIACDAAKLCAARISGLEAPVFENTEDTLEALVGRIDKTLAWLQTVPPAALDGLEDKQVTFPSGKNATRTMSGQDYLKNWALPNMFFHITTAYAILRHNGVVIGKNEFLMGAGS